MLLIFPGKYSPPNVSLFDLRNPGHPNKILILGVTEEPRNSNSKFRSAAVLSDSR